MPIRLRAVDRHFARFCRTGDARALGLVFDRTARELLHLAGWLGGSRGEAEDLLQQTFLTAIEQRAAFGRQRRVLPWLVTILANHARNLRRQRARRAALPQHAGRPEPFADPVAAAADAEFAAWLAGARAALGAPYREVLELHLEHGLNAQEIAARLARPAGTVRTQLVRALERLRRRLPSGFAAVLSPRPPDAAATAIATVKAVVLDAARPPAPLAAVGSPATAVVSTLAGGVLVGKTIAACASLLVLFGAFGTWSWLRSGDRVAAATADAGRGAAVAGATADPARAPERPAQGERQEVALAAVGPPEPHAAVHALRFTGRCVAAEDGTPLGGVTVTFAATGRLDAHAAVAALRGEDRDAVTAGTQSGADGRFELAAERAPGWSQELSFELPGRARVAGSLVPRHGAVDLGDVALPAGVPAAARVVDAAGVPQPGLAVRLAPVAAATASAAAAWLQPQPWLVARSLADGSLPLPAAMLPGRWTVTCLDWEIVGERHWNVAAGAEPFAVVVEANPPAITGVVTDPQGAPIEGVAVQPVQRSTYQGAVPSSDAAGRFVVRRWSTDRPEPHRLALTKPGWRALRTEPIAWGAGELRFVLQPARELELLVVDADTGAPVEGFGVRVTWDHQRVRSDWRTTSGGLQQVGRHAGGRARLLLDDGPHSLCVQPFAGHAPGVPLELDVSDATPRQLVVRVPPTATRTVQVITANGEPVPGSTVELIRRGADDESARDADAVQWSWGWQLGDGVPPIRLAQVVTGSDGCAAIAVPPREEVELRVHGPAHGPATRVVTFAQEPEPLRLVVDVGATLIGRVEPAGFFARVAALGGPDLPPAVQLVQGNEPAQRQHPQSPVAAASDGTFRIEHVPPGTWQVVVVAWTGGSVRTRMLLPLGAPLALLEAEQREVRLDARPSTPCTLRGRVLVNGVPWSAGGVQVRVEHDLPLLRDHAGPSGFGVATDAAGMFTLDRLPGRYRVAIDGIEAPETCLVAAGSTVDATFTIAWGTLALQFVAADGRPVAGAFALVAGPGDAQRPIRAGDDGTVRLHVPPGPIAAGVLPAALRDRDARQAFEAEHTGRVDALRGAAAGIVNGAVAAGAELSLRIVVPDTSGY